MTPPRRQMYIEHVREAALQMRQQRRFARNRAEQQMFEPAADDGVEDRLLAMGDRVTSITSRSARGAVVLRKLAERAFRLAHVGQDAALDDDLGFGRHAHVAGPAFDHRQRPAVQRARDFQFVVVERGDRLRRQQRQRIDADHDGNVERLVRPASAIWKNMLGMARQQQHAEAIRAAHLATVDRDVLLPGPRIARDQQARGDVRPAVVLVVRRHRQLLEQVDFAMHHLLHGRVADLAPRQRIGRGVLEPGEQVSRLDAHRLGHPAAV